MNMEDKRNIAELWKDFEHLSYVVSENEDIQESTAGPESKARWQRAADSCQKKIDVYRPILLERCKSEFGGVIKQIHEPNEDPKWVVSIPPRTNMTTDEAGEIVAVLSFLKWELEQRAKENQGG